jgi:DNA-binding LacI/PurR family transcriptional regulator
MAKELDFGDRTPLYEQIVKDIKAKVERGELKPGEQIWTQQELAAKYGVSLITVKNALAYLVNEGILYARVGRGTFVAEKPARKISLSPNRTLGLVLRDLKHPYFSMIVHSVEQRAYELGFNVLLSSSSGDIEKEENQINHFREMGVDGLIIASLSLEYRATEYIQQLHNEGFPYIMVSYMHDPEYWYVGCDHELGGFMATEHLIKLGYTSIGYAHVGKGNLLSEVRRNGYYRALTEYGAPFRADNVYVLGVTDKDAGEDRFHRGYEFGKNFKTLQHKPDALFFYNDIVALGFLQGTSETGMRVPDDIGIVGFDDSIVARYAAVPLTTIHQPVDSIGRHAVEILQKRIDGKDVGGRTILKPSLIVRESCGAKKRGSLNPPSTRLVSAHD